MMSGVSAEILKKLQMDGLRVFFCKLHVHIYELTKKYYTINDNSNIRL